MKEETGTINFYTLHAKKCVKTWNGMFKNKLKILGKKWLNCGERENNTCSLFCNFLAYSTPDKSEDSNKL